MRISILALVLSKPTLITFCQCLSPFTNFSFIALNKVSLLEQSTHCTSDELLASKIVTYAGFIFFIQLSLEPSLQIEKGLFCLYVTKISCNARRIAIFKIVAVLVGADLNFRAIFESGNILLYRDARWCAVRKETLCCTIKLVFVTSAVIIETLTSDDVIVKKNFPFASAFDRFFNSFVMWSSGVLFYTSESHMMAYYVRFRLHGIQ